MTKDMVLVPREPTPEILAAMAAVSLSTPKWDLQMYRALIASAEQQPAAQPVDYPSAYQLYQCTGVGVRQEAKQEPAAWLARTYDEAANLWEWDAYTAEHYKERKDSPRYHDWTPLYTHPIDPQEVMRLADEYADEVATLRAAENLMNDKFIATRLQRTNEARDALARAVGSQS